MIKRISRSAEALLTWADLGHANALALIVLVGLCLWLPGFESMQPMDRDEPRFAQATKQMLETGDFVDIRFQTEARHKKPVGIYWLQSATVAAGEAFGVQDARRTIWLYRLPSLIGALAAGLLAYWAFLVLATRVEAFAAAMLTVSAILIGVEARLAKTDAVMLATAMATMAVLARCWMLRATVGPTRGEVFTFWLALALSFLLKGPVILMMIVLAAAALSLKERSVAWLRPLVFWPAMLVAGLVVLPWFAAIALKSGAGFFTESLGRDMFAKVGQGKESHWAPPGAYLLMSVATFWPASPFILLALPWLWRHRRDDVAAFCLAWVVPSWIVFEAVPTKLPHYVLPLMPILALAAVRSMSEAATYVRGGWRVAASLVLPAIPILIMAAGVIGTAFLEGLTLTALVPLIIALPVLTLAVIASVLAWVWLGKSKTGPAVLASVAAAGLVYVGVYAFAWSGVRSIQISPRLADSVVAAGCEGPMVASAGYYEPSLVFLTRSDLLFTDGAGAARFLAEGPCRVALVDASQERAFNEVMERGAPISRLAGRQRGFNINGARRLDIGIYVRDRTN